MTSSQDSKIPFIILIPFVAVVLLFAFRSGAPKDPVMPGVVRPLAPVVVAPQVIAEEPATDTEGESTEAETGAESSAETEADEEVWE
jgi:hypothetical protein